LSGNRPDLPPPVATDLSERLTHREREVAEVIAYGASYREAADGLFITVKTVEAHLTRVYRKLGVHSKVQLVRALDELPDGAG
jgi:DNA-binding CsgD family transcriptional regulator